MLSLKIKDIVYALNFEFNSVNKQNLVLVVVGACVKEVMVVQTVPFYMEYYFFVAGLFIFPGEVLGYIFV